jgi:hypothetical protein
VRLCSEGCLSISELIIADVAAYTLGTITRGEQDAFNNVRAFLEKGVPNTPVNGPF